MDSLNLNEAPPQWARLAFRTIEKNCTGQSLKVFNKLYEAAQKEGKVPSVHELFTARFVTSECWLTMFQLGMHPDVLGHAFTVLHARDCKIEAMGMIAAVMISARTCREHMAVLEAYGPVLEPNSTMSVTKAKGGLYFTVNYPHITGITGEVFCNAGVYMLEDYLRRAAGWVGHAVSKVTFHYTAPANAVDVRNLLWAEAHFDPTASVDASDGAGWTYFIPDVLLDAPNPHYNALTNEAAIKALEQLAAYRGRKAAEAQNDVNLYSFQARQTMMAAISLPSQQKVAEAQGITTRALQKRLDSEGTNFQEIRDSVFLEKTKALLQGGKTSVDVARILQMSEEQVRRKFKAMEGATVRQFVAKSNKNQPETTKSEPK